MSINWKKYYDYENNQEIFDKLIKRFKIENYRLQANSEGGNDIIITHGLDVYKLTYDYEKERICVYKRKVARKGSKHNKEYMPFKASFHHDPIYQCLKWIDKDKQY